MSTIDITGIDKARLLAALHNNTRAVGMGFLNDIGRDLTDEEAAEIVREHAAFSGPEGAWVSFDYVMGRPIKVSFRGDLLVRPDLYDRDAPGGEGTCQRIVDSLRPPD